jgi:hypothetical protein
MQRKSDHKKCHIDDESWSWMRCRHRGQVSQSTEFCYLVENLVILKVVLEYIFRKHHLLQVHEGRKRHHFCSTQSSHCSESCAFLLEFLQEIKSSQVIRLSIMLTHYLYKLSFMAILTGSTLVQAGPVARQEPNTCTTLNQRKSW